MSGWTSMDMPDQRGRVVAVTGATSGLGRATAGALARHGARVVLLVRDTDRGQREADAIRAGSPTATVDVVRLDLEDLASVRAGAKELAERVDRLDVLVANAGIMAVPPGRTVDGFERQIGTNHLGHVALVAAALPLLRSAGAPRVVSVSSLAHRQGTIDVDDLSYERRGYRPWPVYGQSKLANLVFTAELARRAERAGWPLLAVAAHPGYSATNLQGGAQSRAARLVTSVLNRVVAQSAEHGAWPQLQAATDLAVRSGEFYGPARLGGSRGPSVRIEMPASTRDEQLGAALWSRSLELVGAETPGL